MRFPFLIHTFHLIFVGWPLPSSYSWCWLRPPGHRSHPAPASGWKCRDPDVEWSSMKSIVPKAWIKNKQTTNHLPACKKMLVLWHDTLKFSERCPRRCMEERPPPTKKNILGPGIMQHLTRCQISKKLTMPSSNRWWCCDVVAWPVGPHSPPSEESQVPHSLNTSWQSIEVYSFCCTVLGPRFTNSTTSKQFRNALGSFSYIRGVLVAITLLSIQKP